jgi:trigger factor
MQLIKKVKKEPNSKISLDVTVDKETVTNVREEVIRDFEQNAKLPGFRKGKVPRNIIMTRFSKNIQNETASSVMRDSINQIIKEEKYHPISHPSVVEADDLTDEEDFSFKAEFDVMPEVKLGEYRGISSEKFVYEVSEELVDREIEGLRERFATLTSKDESSKIGDYVVLDYEEFGADGKIKTKKKNQTVLIDKKEDQLASQLVGLKAGDEKDISLSQEYEEEGEKKTYRTSMHVKVKDVKEKNLPELNDDFAKDISDAKTIEELKKKVREGLEKEADSASENKTKDALLKKLIELCEIDLPETLVNYEIDRIIANIAYTYRMDLEKLRKDEDQYKEYRENARPAAINNSKQDLILDEIVKKEEIKVDKKELDTELKEVAEKSKKSVDALKNELEQKGTLENYRYRITMRKALDLVYDSAKLDKEKRLPYMQNEKEEE